MSSRNISGKEVVQRKDEALLASLGYKQEFKREFTPFEVFGVAFSIIGLLPSIASVLFYAIINGGGPAMVWGWFTGCILVMTVALAMAELASLAPTSGGLYWWTYTFASPRSKKFLCWIVGYANTVGLISGFASVDWACTQQVMVAANIGSGGRFVPTDAQLFGVYVGLILSHMVVSSLATAALARLQWLYVFLNIVLCLVVIIGLPAATPRAMMNTAKFALWDFNNASGWPNGFAFMLSLIVPAWTVSGFDCSVHISEEVSNAAIAVPWSIISAAGISSVLGWAIILALVFCMGTDLDSLRSTNQPMALIFVNRFGEKPALILWAFVIITQYMMGSSVLLAASRQTFAFSRDSALPFSRWLYRMNKSTGTPVHAVIFDGTLTILLGLLVFATPQAVNAVFSLSAVGAALAYSIPIAARFSGNKELKPGPFSMGVFGKPVSILAVLFMAFMSIVFVFPSSPKPTVATMNYTLVVFGAAMVLALGWYYFPKYGGVHWFTGPIRTFVDEEEIKAEVNEKEAV